MAEVRELEPAEILFLGDGPGIRFVWMDQLIRLAAFRAERRGMQSYLGYWRRK